MKTMKAWERRAQRALARRRRQLSAALLRQLHAGERRVAYDAREARAKLAAEGRDD